MSTKELLITDKEKVRKEWGKTASDVEATISILKQWLGTQQHLPEIPDSLNETWNIATGVRESLSQQACAMDRERANVLSLFEPYDDSFIEPVPFSMRYNGHIVFLPKQTDSLCRVCLVKNSDDAEALDLPIMVTYVGNMFEIRLLEDLEMGLILVFDLANASIAHALKFNATIVKNFMFLIENFSSCRIKEFHLINYPSYINTVLAIVKMVMKKKLYDRIHLHTDMESFYKYIPHEMMPSDYGGKEKSLQELTDLWQLKFKEYEKRFDQLADMEVNEKLRPEPLSNSDILGYYGNFTKLDVD